ncbi:MAG: HlyD family efflux transporter periplasmic adaptor subunit [Pseudomonadota bacterium]
MFRPKTKHLVVAVAMAAAAAGLVYLFILKPLAVLVVVPGQQVPIQVFGLGTVEAKVLSRVGFKITGTLAELKVDQGAMVKTGEVLARLDSREQQNRVAKALANREKAQASLLVARANLAKARTTLTLRQHNNRRRQALLKRGVLAAEAAEEAQASAETARAEVELMEAEVAAAQAALGDAEAQIGLDKVLLAQHTLVAPYDALVVTRQQELGSALQVGEPVFSLVDPCSVWARAFVDESKAGHLAVGQPAEVRLRSLPGESFPGKVVRIDIESDRVGEERRVNVAWERCPRGFHLGEQAEVVITTASLAGAVLVPQAVVLNLAGNEGEIWTLEDGRINRRRVAFGQGTLDGRLAVITGLPPEARPLAALPAGLRIGRRAVAQAEARP